MPLLPDSVRRALERIATVDGVTAEQVAANIRDEDGSEPDERELLATLTALRFAGEAYRSGDRYYLPSVGGPHGPDGPFDWRTVPASQRPIDLPFPSHFVKLDPWRQQLAGLITRWQPPAPGPLVHGYVHPGHRRPAGPLPYIAMEPGGLLDDETKARVLDAVAKLVPSTEPDILDDFRWTTLSDRVLTGTGGGAGEWTLIYLTDPPRHQPGRGPGWYLYGPDVTALPLGEGTVADVLEVVENQVRASVQVHRAQLEQQGPGPIVPDEVRAAIHAGHVTQIVIFCDRCGVKHRADYIGETREDRFAAGRRHLTERKAWKCDETGDHCPVCRAAAS